MKYPAVALTFIAAVAAQSAAELASAIPACAMPSIEEAATSFGCGVTDYVCQCGSKKDQLYIIAYSKFSPACLIEIEAVREATEALCNFVKAISTTTSAFISSEVADFNAAGMNAVNMGAMLGAAGVVAAMI